MEKWKLYNFREEKSCLLSGHAQISWGNPPPNSDNLVLFFWTSKQRFARMTEKSTSDDYDGCIDNYDGHFDDNDDKNDQKTYKYHDFWVKMYQF